MKSALAFGGDIVCVEPALYGRRFCSFMEQQVVFHSLDAPPPSTDKKDGASRDQSQYTSDSSSDSESESSEGSHLKPSGAALISSPKQSKPVRNKNSISQYTWLEELLLMIVDRTGLFALKDMNTGQRGTPLFVVAGACPNKVTGMQAVMYSYVEDAVLFWWIKPQDKNPTLLERNTKSTLDWIV